MGSLREKLGAIKDIMLSKDEPQPAQESMITATGAIDTLQDFAYLVNNVFGQYQFNEEQIGRCNAETQDLLHEIELTSFNAAKGYMLVKELKKVREDRRYYKDQNEILLHFTCFLDRNQFIGKDIDGALQSMTGRVKAQDDRQYKPRVRQPLEDEQEGTS